MNLPLTVSPPPMTFGILVFLFGCDPTNTLKQDVDAHPGEDTATPESEPVDMSGCFPGVYPYALDWDATNSSFPFDNATCALQTSLEYGMGTVERISYLKIRGRHTATPQTKYAFKGIREAPEYDWATPSEDLSDVTRFGATDITNPTMPSATDPNAAYNWYAEWDGTTGNIDALVPPGYPWTIHFAVDDSTRAGASPHQCAEYGDIPAGHDIQWCINLENLASRRKVSAYASCESGSGRVQLVPFRFANHDDDSNVSVLLYPILKSGTGVLTPAAWMTSITMVTSQGQTFRAARSGHPQRFDTGNDTIHEAALRTVPISSSGATTLPPGVVHGLGPFLIEEAPLTTTSNFEADITWQCATPSPGELVYGDSGYTLSLADLGCGVSWPQQVTMRLVPELAPKSISLELYGSPRAIMRSSATANGNGGYDFELKGLQGRLKGSVDSVDPSVGAVVTLSDIELHGSEVCTSGTYTLLPEQ